MFEYIDKRLDELKAENAQLKAKLSTTVETQTAYAQQCNGLIVERDQLKAQLEQAQPLAQELGATRYELDQAQAACAEMRGVLHLAKEMTRPGYHANPYHGLEHCHFDLHAAIEKALSSTTCGRGWFNVEQLKPTIELLTRLQQLQGKSLAHWPDLPRELDRLKALVPPIK